MLKEIETEETTGFVVAFLSLMALRLGGGGGGAWLRLCSLYILKQTLILDLKQQCRCAELAVKR